MGMLPTVIRLAQRGWSSPFEVQKILNGLTFSSEQSFPKTSTSTVSQMEDWINGE